MAHNSTDIKSSFINTATVGTRMVLTPRGSLIGKNCEELEALFNELLIQQKTDIILDCKAVSFLDSEALELLLRMHEELNNRGGMLKIISMNEVCQDILFATRLVNVFHLYEDIHKAVVSRT